MATIIINADDLGIHPDIDMGIAESYSQGVVSSATLLATTPFAERAVKDIVVPKKMHVGVHLSLTLGWAVSPPPTIPDLVDKNGAFRLTARQIVRYNGSPHFWSQVEFELAAQIQRILDFGLCPTHLDSHQHIHLNPKLCTIVNKLGKRFGISCMRIGYEPAWLSVLFHRPVAGFKRANLLKWLFSRWRLLSCSGDLRSTDRFFGLLHSGTFDENLLRQLLSHQDEGKTWEIACHPGYPAKLEGKSLYPQAGVDAFITSAERQVEMKAVCSSAVAEAARNSTHKFTNFSDI